MVLGLSLAMMLGSPMSGPTVEIAPFAGGTPAQELRDRIGEEIREEGFEVVEADASFLTEPFDPRPASLERIDGDSEARFVVFGRVAGPQGAPLIEVVVAERGQGVVERFEARWVEGDLILPLILPDAIATSIVHRIAPPPPPTDEERRVLERLDEPARDEEHPRSPITGCILRRPDAVPSGPPRVDLRKDFEMFCRVGPRRGRDDLRPVCKRGPVWGYVHRRTWVTGAATLLAGGATGAAFGLRTAGWSHGGARWAGYDVSAPLTAWGATSAAITGTLLGATVVLLVSDRRRARQYIRQERALRWGR